MQQPQRLIFLALAIGWTIFRLLRYLRAAGAKRPGPAIPPAAGTLPHRPAQAAVTPAAVQSPIEPAGGSGGRRAAILVAAGLLIAGNAVMWPVLFALPALEEVPALWRLLAGVLANLVLIRVASRVAARVAARSQSGAEDSRDPIS